MNDTARRTQGRLVPVALFGLVAAVALWAATPAPVGAFVDDGFYAVLAESLATGQGYRYLHVPGAPHATHFPPGYPALLALLWLAWPSFPDNVVLFRLANVLLTAGAGVGAYLLGRRRLGLGVRASAAAAAAGALSVPSLLLTGMLLSEPLFLALLFPTLFVAERAADEDTADDASRLRLAAAAGALCGALMLVRTIAAVLAVAAVVVLLVRRRTRLAATLAAVAAAVSGPWQLWVAAHDAAVPDVLGSMYTSYGGWVAGAVGSGGASFLPDVLGRNAAHIGGLLGDAFAPGGGGAHRVGAALAVCALVAVGLARAAAGAPGTPGAAPWWRRGPAAVTAAFVLLYLGVVALWPFDPSRFVWALWPLLFMLAASGALTIARWRPASRPAVVLHAAALVASVTVAVGAATYYVRGYRERWWGNVPRMAEGTLVPLMRWVAARTAPSDVIVTPGETTIYLYTHRRTLPADVFTPTGYLRKPSPDEDAILLQGVLDRFSVDYVLVASRRGELAADALMTMQPGRLTVVARPPGAIVLATGRR